MHFCSVRISLSVQVEIHEEHAFLTSGWVFELKEMEFFVSPETRANKDLFLMGRMNLPRFPLKQYKNFGTLACDIISNEHYI